MSGSTKRWSKRKYQEHIFDRARGKTSRHANDNTAAESRGWFNLTFDQERMSDMFEENSVRGSEGHAQARDAAGETYTSWTEAGRTERERFRQDQQEALKKQFRQNLGKHPAFRDKTQSEISKIADAYLAGDDFDGKDADKETAAALKEVADYTTGDGETYMSDDRTWRAKYPKATKTDATTDAKTGGDAMTGAKTGKGAQHANGSPQPASGSPRPADNPQQPVSQKPLAPRGGTPPPGETPVGTVTKTLGADDTGVRVNGAPLRPQNTGGRWQLERRQTADLARDAINAEESRKDASSRASSGERRRYLERAEEEYDLDKRSKALRERKDADRRAEAERRQAARVKNRTLSNQADWDALGREANADSYDVNEAGIDEKEKARRQGLVDERKSKVAGLRERIAAATDKTLIGDDETAVRVKGEDGTYTTQVYKTKDIEGKAKNATSGGYDGVNAVSAEELAERAKTHTGVGSPWHYAGHVAGNAANLAAGLGNLDRHLAAALEDGSLSDAQLEAAEKNLRSSMGQADAGKARSEAVTARAKATEAAKYRKMYGLNDRSTFTDDDVIGFHNEKQKAARDKIIKDAFGDDRTSLGLTSSEALSSNVGHDKFNKVWQGLLDNGWDVVEAEKKATADKATKDAYLNALKALDVNSKDYSAQADTLKQRMLLNQAFKDAGGVLDEGAGASLGADLPTRQRYLRAAENQQASEPGSLELLDANRAAQAAEDTARADGLVGRVDALTPKNKPAVVPAEDPRKTQQLAKGGVLRPRRGR